VHLLFIYEPRASAVLISAVFGILAVSGLLLIEAAEW
jgi:hypothetical protein